MFDPVIIGLGETQVGSLPGFTQWEIQAEAVRRAVRDAGLEKGDVDGLINSPPYSRPHQMFSLEMSEYLGLRPKTSLTMDVGGTATVLTMVETARSFSKRAAATWSWSSSVTTCAPGGRRACRGTSAWPRAGAVRNGRSPSGSSAW